MTAKHLARSFALAGLCAAALPVAAEDIDIFTAPGTGSSGSANVLIVLDNTANWSANNQGWPDMTQGQSEIDAISKIVAKLNSSVNVGLMLLTTVSGNPGGMMVQGIKPMTPANIITWQTWLSARYANITDPDWKAPSSANYGAAMFDAFKYFGGFTSPAHAADDVPGSPVDQTHFGMARYASIPTARVDPAAYTADYARYVSSITNPCANNYIVFIGNGFPNADSTTLLPGVGGDTSAVQPNAMDGGSSVYAADEWARFMYQTDVSSLSGQQRVRTFTINVFGTSPGPKQPTQANYLSNMARVGGGEYYVARNSADVLSALANVFANIQSFNETFASASLPVSATNRAQNANQVFIGMFRPDPLAKPRWMGNMKQYQLTNSGTTVDLADKNLKKAVDPTTGFIDPCATSFWTTDSGTYWSNVTVNSSATAICPPESTPFSRFSDAPDGPVVEKGSVAEIIRKGNNPPTTDTTPTWTVNRTVYTHVGSNLGLVDFTAASSGLAQDLVDYTLGKDVNDENGNSNKTEVRPSVHGDVVHSRPLPVNYGTTNGVTVFYGSNDGMLHAVNGDTGKERWAFVAPEFFPRLQRLKDNTPLINYPGLITTTSTPAAKDYFFDGAIGVYQNANNSRVWIYPGMRRGGRMLYALDVTNPATPSLKWKVGCPNLSNDTGCTDNYSGLGQTWSTPSVALIKGFSTTDPVLVVGGGYDNCEDVNSGTTSCTSSSKGAGVYIINAASGARLAFFPTARSVIADISLIDIDNDGMVDYAYAVDTGGNVYRIDFINSPSTKNALSASNWVANKVAYTNNGGRKFMFAPALLQAGTKVYLAVGSGDREHPLQSQYPYTTPITNRFYVYLDDLAASTATNLDDATIMLNNTAANSCDATTALPGGTRKGWFIDLTGNGAGGDNGVGEQVVTSAVIAGGMVAFSTNRPVPPSGNSCSAGLGEARGYWVNLLNGSGTIGIDGICGGRRSSIFTGGGLPPSPVMGVVSINGKPITVIIGAAQREGTASSPIASQQIRPAVNGRRKTVYWKTSGEN